jgi:hypothetical protein
MAMFEEIVASAAAQATAESGQPLRLTAGERSELQKVLPLIDDLGQHCTNKRVKRALAKMYFYLDRITRHPGTIRQSC